MQFETNKYHKIGRYAEMYDVSTQYIKGAIKRGELSAKHPSERVTLVSEHSWECFMNGKQQLQEAV